MGGALPQRLNTSQGWLETYKYGKRCVRREHLVRLPVEFLTVKNRRAGNEKCIQNFLGKLFGFHKIGNFFIS
jgi:hypothetical protein